MYCNLLIAKSAIFLIVHAITIYVRINIELHILNLAMGSSLTSKLLRYFVQLVQIIAFLLKYRNGRSHFIHPS